MPRTEEASQRLRETQRENILQGARKVFAQKGMSATMDDIAAAAAVSHGLAYRYFASKEEIFHELVKQILHTDPAGVRRLAEEAGTAWERLARLLSRLMESRHLFPEIYQLLDQIRRSERTPADLREQMNRQGEIFQESLRQLIIEGQAEGSVVAGDPDQLLMAVSIWLEGINRWKLLDPQRIDKHWPDVEIALRMLKAGADERNG
jgi:AcrR family transcriptional regulator